MSVPSRIDTQNKADRQTIHAQMWIGAGLVVFGAMLLVIFHFSGMLDNDTTAGSAALFGSVATGVLAVGAALLPATAAGAAGGRLDRQSQEADHQPPHITNVEVINDRKAIMARISATDGSWNAFVETATAASGFTEPAPLRLTHVAASRDIQTISLLALPDGSALPAGTRVRIVLTQDDGMTYNGPSVTT